MPRNSLSTQEIASLKIGDKVTQYIFKKGTSRLRSSDGEVYNIDHNIQCFIENSFGDSAQLMVFCRETGVNVLGEEFGWLGKE